MAKPGMIPKTVSRPADPDAPSFLTTLPAEVRNAIYEILFKRDEPVLLHNADAYYPNYPKQKFGQSNRQFQKILDRYDQSMKEHVKKGQEFKHGFGTELPILLTCHQTYHECVGVLYGSKFMISRALHRHEAPDDYHLEWDKQYGQLQYAPKWLSGIGSQIKVLRQILVDIDATCPLSCSITGQRGIDILPFVLLIWDQPDLESKIKFCTTGRRLEAHPAGSGINAKILNNLLVTIGVQDSLRLKIFRSSNRFLRSICVSEDAGEAQDFMVSVHLHKPGLYNMFKASDNGKTVTPDTETPPRNKLNRLPAEVLHQVYVYAARLSPEVVFDLYNQTIRGLNLNLLYLEKRLVGETELWEAIALATPITLRTYAIEPETTFGDFAALRALLDKIGPTAEWDPLSSILLAPRKQPSPLTLELQLNLQKNATFVELDIDIHGLVSFLCWQPSIVIRVLLTCPRDGRPYREWFSIDVDKLRMNLFLMLTDMIELWPTTFHVKKDARVSSVRIDGRGSLRSVTCSSNTCRAAFTRSNHYSQHTKEDMHHLGFRNLEVYKEMVSKHNVHLGVLHQALGDLEHIYWAN